MQWQQVLVIRNTTVEGPLFQTTLLYTFPIPKTGLYNFGKHVEKADDTSEQSSNLLNKPVRLPKKKKNQNFKKGGSVYHPASM